MPKPRLEPWQMSTSYSQEEFAELDSDVAKFLQMLWGTDVEEKNGVGSFTVYLTAEQLGKVIGQIQSLRVMAQEWWRGFDDAS